MRTLLLAGVLVSTACAQLQAQTPFGGRRAIASNADDVWTTPAADLDADGDLDILASCRDRFLWYENIGPWGDPWVWPTHVIDDTILGGESVIVADLDGDGDLDAAGAASADDAVYWFESDGQQPLGWTTHVVSIGTGSPSTVHATDLDSDGDVDLASASYFGDAIIWHENDGSSPPIWTDHVLSTTSQGARFVDSGDLDGDGDQDLVSASYLDDTVAWFENLGGSPPAFSMEVISSNFEGARSVEVADLDGDGDEDVLGAAEAGLGSGGGFHWFENDGSDPPSWPFRTIDSIEWAAYVHVADLDEDGDRDVVGSAWLLDRVLWYENDGQTPPAWTRRTLTTEAEEVHGIHSGDLDGDGDREVISTASAVDRIGIFENRAGAAFIENLEPPVAGKVVTAEVRGLTPDTDALLLWGLRSGVTSGTAYGQTYPLDMADPRLGGSGMTDAAGAFSSSATLPLNLSGQTLYLQAIDRGGAVSGLLVQPIE